MGVTHAQTHSVTPDERDSRISHALQKGKKEIPTAPNDKWEIWKQLFKEVVNKHASIQKRKIRSQKTPWITSNIKKLINIRDLKRRAIITNLESNWSNYKISRMIR
jgi:hypothetical protein